MLAESLNKVMMANTKPKHEPARVCLGECALTRNRSHWVARIDIGDTGGKAERARRCEAGARCYKRIPPNSLG